MQIWQGHFYRTYQFYTEFCHLLLSLTVAEAIYEFGYPRRRYVAQNFSCANFTYGLRNCNFSSSYDPECAVGPHVAGVRCRESEYFS